MINVHSKCKYKLIVTIRFSIFDTARNLADGVMKSLPLRVSQFNYPSLYVYSFIIRRFSSVQQRRFVKATLAFRQLLLQVLPFFVQSRPRLTQLEAP
jgi:hypothetical protein